jgi:hypothetical protein
MFDEFLNKFLSWLLFMPLAVHHDNLLHYQTNRVVLLVLMERTDVSPDELVFL